MERFESFDDEELKTMIKLFKKLDKSQKDEA